MLTAYLRIGCMCHIASKQTHGRMCNASLYATLTHETERSCKVCFEMSSVTSLNGNHSRAVYYSLNQHTSAPPWSSST